MALRLGLARWKFGFGGPGLGGCHFLREKAIQAEVGRSLIHAAAGCAFASRSPSMYPSIHLSLAISCLPLLSFSNFFLLERIFESPVLSPRRSYLPGPFSFPCPLSCATLDQSVDCGHPLASILSQPHLPPRHCCSRPCSTDSNRSLELVRYH